MQITFNEVKGYATYANAEKRGQEVADQVANWIRPALHPSEVRWCVIAKADGRFVPAFLCTDKVGPQFFLGLTNVCTFN